MWRFHVKSCVGGYISGYFIFGGGILSVNINKNDFNDLQKSKN